MIQAAISFEGTLTSARTRIIVGLLLFAFIALQRLVAWASRGGAGWLTGGRRRREVRPA
jgi:simple sugar transport system permease protein